MVTLGAVSLPAYAHPLDSARLPMLTICQGTAGYQRTAGSTEEGDQ